MFHLSRPLVRRTRLCKCISSSVKAAHENPLGLPRSGQRVPPQMPRRTPIGKRSIPHVKRVLVVASGKGGVGKSTVAVNLAFHLAMLRNPTEESFTSRRLRVGVLDLDVFGPSIPTLMGLRHAPEPDLTPAGALVPLTNHGMPCMSMGFLLPKTPAVDGKTYEESSNEDTPIVWRGLMVQKAVQQLLFDVDWRTGTSASSEAADSKSGLDVLVVDMPPGTGDVPLTLGQLVNVDGAVIVSTPQDVALSDVRRGISMFRKVNVPITGLLLNQANFYCPSCTTPHPLFGSPDSFRKTADRMGIRVLGELPLVSAVSQAGDAGRIYGLQSASQAESTLGEKMWVSGMDTLAQDVWQSLR
ncbi:hypothetical protein HGRIS_014387 [Hohenbuehelia grisea]|uniref:P-loop containing nucleoside triphosphate hydrolase protein n=1 Tax=Hohenbuehelia grisea TaxID=104357 RepID=A0ABR3JT78_9AGAR